MLVYYLSGTGDVIESDDGILAIGSGGPFALKRCKSINKKYKNECGKEIANESLNIAADVCIYTNHNIVIEEIKLYRNAKWNLVLAQEK